MTAALSTLTPGQPAAHDEHEAYEAPIRAAYARLAALTVAQERCAAAVDAILTVFDEFYRQLCEYPYRAKLAFELRDPHASIRISEERLGLYSRYVAEHGPRLRAAYPDLSHDISAWEAIERRLVAAIVDRYEADIVFSFAHSLRRNVAYETWRPVAYSFPPPSRSRKLSMASAHRRIPVRGRVGTAILREALCVPEFSVPFRDLDEDVERIRERLDRVLYGQRAAGPVALDVIEAGFFRDRAAFVVGRWVLADDTLVPFVVALLNGPQGIYADAVLHQVADIHDLFSSTLANFHVTTRLYYQTCVFLYSLMPLRPLGHHYSTIGYNHIGKVAILEEITAQVRAGARLRRSPGAAGTVALGFTFEGCAYHLKVIRDRPTASYKWGDFPGVAAVLEKYRAVHEINRAGSMLDNVMYFNLGLDSEMFDPVLLDEIWREASGSVLVDQEGVFLRSLIVQLKITPLPVYLESANEGEIRAVIAALGHCIRNNAATNIFNKDLDCRNYGVGRYGRVFLFDYDAVERLTEVKIRTNRDREPGEEDVPSWFFEDGVVFLPEELEYGMSFQNDHARRYFRELNADLMTVEYWVDVQQKLLRGEIPPLKMYPTATLLAHEPARAPVR